MKRPNFTRPLYGVGELKQKFFFFFFLNLATVVSDTAPQNFANICQIKWNWIRSMKFETVRIRWRFRFTVTQKFCYRDVTTSLYFQEYLASVRLSERTDVAKTSPAKTRRAWSGDMGGGGKGRIASSLPSPRVLVFLSFFGIWKRLRRPLHKYGMKANGKKTLMFSLYLSRFVLFSVWLTVFIFTLIKMP